MKSGITTPKEERDIWDSKVNENVAYEVWNESNPVKWESMAFHCAAKIVKNIKGAKNVLEIGSGIGRLTVRIATRLGVKVIGLDISQKMIDRAAKHKAVKYILGDGRKVPLEDNSIYAVYSMITFQHIPNKAFQGYIKEIGRVLKLNGVAYFQYVEGDNIGHLSHDANIEDVSSWCAKAGLEIVDVQHGLGLVFDNWTWIKAVKA